MISVRRLKTGIGKETKRESKKTSIGKVKKKNFDIKSLWGNGFTYYNLLSNYDQIDRTDIKNRILNPFLRRDLLGYIFISKYLSIILE